MSVLDELTPKQQAALIAYFGEAKGSKVEAYRMAGYSLVGNIAKKASELFSTSRMKKALAEQKEKNREKFWLAEEDILRGIYKEAILTKEEGGTQQGRVQAWVYLGKHIGMFSEKPKEEVAKQITYNIVNYSDDGQLKKKIEQGVEENKGAILEYRESSVEIKDYSEED